MAGFFSTTKDTWSSYQPLRDKYSDGIPIPQRSYFRPIRSIDNMAEIAARPIANPLWLGFNALGFLIKAVLHLAVAIVLAPFSLVLSLVAPNSDLTQSCTAAFKLAAAQSVVSIGMAALAVFSAAMALIFNPLYLAARAASTVLNSINSTTESCCDFTIARL